MNEATAIESIRVAARRGAAFARFLGPIVSDGIKPITSVQDIPSDDRYCLEQNFGDISPAMIAAYRGAFEGAA